MANVTQSESWPYPILSAECLQVGQRKCLFCIIIIYEPYYLVFFRNRGKGGEEGGAIIISVVINSRVPRLFLSLRIIIVSDNFGIPVQHKVITLPIANCAHRGRAWGRDYILPACMHN